MADASSRILVVSDSPDYYSTRDLRRLYPDLVDEHDLNQGPVTADRLAPYSRVWTLIRRAENRGLLDYRLVRAHARERGARVVSHLFEYACGSGLEFRFRNAGKTRHKLAVVAQSDPITRGYAVGDTVYWYRNSSDIDDPAVGHYAYREVLCEDDPASGRTVLARSTLTGGAMWIEERFPSGGILLACDLYSPIDLALTQGDPWLLHRGAFAKYIPAGNLFGGTVRYGRYQDRKLTVEEVLERIRALPGEVRDEGPSSEGTPVLSVRLGNPDRPQVLLLAAKHGVEWENVHGMLVTLEELASGRAVDLDRICVVALPLLNPYGYRHGVRHNANGVDLNRQLRRDWQTFRGWTDEVAEPWTFDFKGAARAAEPEARIEARLLAEPGLACHLDAHAMAGEPVLGGSGPNPGLIRELVADIAASLRNRYLIRYLPDAEPRQLTLRLGDVGEAPVTKLYYENLGQLPDVHATVLQTDLAAEINLSVIRRIAAEH